MGTFTIQTKTENIQYKFENTDVVITGSYAKDATTDTLQSIGGTAYVYSETQEQGDYIGNFNGYNRDGEIKYSISEMSRRAAQKVWTAIDEIESHIVTNAEEEQ